MAATTGTPATLQLDPAALARAVAAFPQQQLVVSTQNPQAGATLAKGSTVQVTLIDLSSIPIVFFHPDLPPAMQTMTVADATRLVAASPDLKAAITDTQSTVTPTKAAELINAAGTATAAATESAGSGTAPIAGITGTTLTAADASKTLIALKSISALGAIRL